MIKHCNLFKCSSLFKLIIIHKIVPILIHFYIAIIKLKGYFVKYNIDININK